MPERSSNVGYLAIKPETTKGVVAGVPNVVVPIYSENFATDVGLDEDNPIVGNVFARFQTLLGRRSHSFEFQSIAEPNTIAHLFAMLMTRSATGGSDPYTHTFGFSTSTNPKSYTADIAKGQVVMRFAGCEASEISNEFDESKMLLNVTGAALKSFIVREISALANDTEITLKTNYDESPTDLLVAGDLMRIMKADGSYVDFVIDSVESGVRIDSTTTLSGIADGDLLFIRPSAVSLANKTPFNWVRTEARFGADDDAALIATQTRLDELAFTLSYEFEDENGAQRSGAPDPASLVRTQANAEVELKRYFDDPREYHKFLTNLKNEALVLRHFSEDDYELRITFFKFARNEYMPEMSSGDPIYAEYQLWPEYSPTEGMAVKVEVINALSTIV